MVRTRGGAGSSNANENGPPPVIPWGQKRKRTLPETQLFDQFKEFMAMNREANQRIPVQQEDHHEAEDRAHDGEQGQDHRQERQAPVDISDEEAPDRRKRKSARRHRRRSPSTSGSDPDSDSGSDSSSSDEEDTKGKQYSRKDVPNLMGRFQRMSPPEFNGKGGVETAEAWLTKIGRQLDTMQYHSEVRVLLASACLDGLAFNWWKRISKEMKRKSRKKGRKNSRMSWKEFSDTFKDKWIGSAASDARMVEFEALVQGDRSVAEYEYEFERLIEYVPHYNGKEKAKTDRFIRGLKRDLRRTLEALELTSFSQAVRRAQKLERTDEEEEKKKKAIPPPQSGGKSSSDHGRDRRAGNPGKPGSFPNKGKAPVQGQSYPECPHCGKRHYGECYLKTGKCLNCGSIGHRAVDCPRQVGTGQPRQQNRGQGAQQQRPQFQPQQQRSQPARQPQPQKNPNADRIFVIEKEDPQQGKGALAGT